MRSEAPELAANGAMALYSFGSTTGVFGQAYTLCWTQDPGLGDFIVRVGSFVPQNPPLTFGDDEVCTLGQPCTLDWYGAIPLGSVSLGREHCSDTAVVPGWNLAPLTSLWEGGSSTIGVATARPWVRDWLPPLKCRTECPYCIYV